LRNAVDHGIESPEERTAAGKAERGRILLSAKHEQGHIVLTIEDDGKGIDAEKLRQSAVRKGLLSLEEANALPDDKAIELIFLSGFSTAAAVTDLSGRGVGMDIVRSNIQRINGNIHVDTRPGYGTQFSIVLPLTLAIVPTLLVKVDETSFAIPLVMVAETLRLSKSEIRSIRGEPVIVLREQVLPLICVAEAFGLRARASERKVSYVVVVQAGKQRVGLIVDALMGEEEVVVKTLGALVGDIPGVSSGAILGDGQIALIIDVPGLLRLAGIH
ncbi:MAG TPA: chemotaxis protein CheW, partial [Anaerolineaceae bacterium]|nr:chemotaxis protein CheW [Anaerolineaceae bacterium]